MGNDWLIPEHCLIRFLDVTVEPGFVYEYQVSVRMANPNYEKFDLVAFPAMAQVKELESPPVKVGNPVYVPDDLYYYASDTDAPKADKDETRFQVHRWLDIARLNPNEVNSNSRFGEWAIAETKVHRGEYIGKTEDVEIPMWATTLESYFLPINPARLAEKRPPRTPAPKGIPVDLNTRAVLVDFEGGKGQYKVGNLKTINEVDENVAMLVLTAEGKLEVRNSKADLANEERKNRDTGLKAWVDTVRKEADGTGPGTPGGLFDDPKKVKPK